MVYLEIKRHCAIYYRALITLLLIALLPLPARSAVDPDFNPRFYTYGEVPEMVWNPVSEWLYCRVVAERIDHQDLDTNMIRLDEDGNWDDTWALDHDGDITCIALLDDGKMLIGGDFTEVDGHATFRVARLNVDGSVDTAFTATSTDLPAPDGEAFIDALAADESGNVFVGLFSEDVEYVGNVFFCIGPLSSVLTPTFKKLSTSNYDSHGIRAIHVDDDGLLIGGSYSTINGVNRPCLARLTFTGSVDVGFNIPLSLNGYGTPYYDPKFSVNDIVQAADGNLWIGGCFTSEGRPGVLRITPTGDALEPSTINIPGGWGWNNGLIRDLAAYGNDVLVVGFKAGNSGGSRISIQCYIGIDGQVKTNIPAGTWSGSIENVDGKIAVGRTVGFTPAINDLSQQRSIVFSDAFGNIIQDASQLYLSKSTVPSMATIRPGNGPIYFGHDILSVNDVHVKMLFALNTKGSFDASFNPEFTVNNLNDILLFPDGRILLVGSFSHESWDSSRGVLVIEPDGSLAQPFDQIESRSMPSWHNIQSILLPSGDALLTHARDFDGRYVLGSLLINSAKIDIYQELDTSLKVDEVYSARYSGNAQSYDVVDTVRAALVGGEIELSVTDSDLNVSPSDPSEVMELEVRYRTVYGDHTVNIDEGGELILPRLSWDTEIAQLIPVVLDDSPIASIALHSNDRLVFQTYEGNLTRAFLDGTIDTTFQPPEDFFVFAVESIFADRSDRTYLFGRFEKNQGDNVSKLIRLMPDGTYDSSYQPGIESGFYSAMNLDDQGYFFYSGLANISGNIYKYLLRFDASGQLIDDIDDLDDYSYYIAYQAPNYLYANDKRYIFADPIPPEVFITPSTAQRNEGDEVTFWLADRGADESYQWLTNGFALPGQTGPSLTLDPTTLANAGEISVQATGPGGTVTRTAMLGVTGFDFNDWGASVGLTPGELSDPDADPDGNGLSLNHEYLLRTDLDGPTTQSWATPILAGGEMTLRWRMLPGRRYWVDCSTNLVEWDPIGYYSTEASSVVEMPVDYDPEAPCFYRVRVELDAS